MCGQGELFLFPVWFLERSARPRQSGVSWQALRVVSNDVRWEGCLRCCGGREEHPRIDCLYLVLIVDLAKLL